MTGLVCIGLSGNDATAARLAALVQGELATLETRQFPDGESYLRLRSDVANKQVAVVCTLDRPDGKFLPMAYAAATARELGAARVGLVAPYLAYMRQDRRSGPVPLCYPHQAQARRPAGRADSARPFDGPEPPAGPGR